MKKCAMTKLLVFTLAVSMAWGGYTLPVKAEEQPTGTEQQQNDYIAPEKPIWIPNKGGISFQIKERRELFYRIIVYRDGETWHSTKYGKLNGEKEKQIAVQSCFTESGVYTAKVFAYETDKYADCVVESELSDEFIYTYPEEKLNTPTNLQWVRKNDTKYAVATCDSVAYAGTYYFTLYKDGNYAGGGSLAGFNGHSEGTTISYDFSKKVTDVDAHEYTFTVEVYPIDVTTYANSDISAPSAAYGAVIGKTSAEEVIKSINADETDSVKIVENVDTIRAQENSELQNAMQTSKEARENLAKIETNYAQAKGIETKVPSSSVPSIDANKIKVVGAALNVDSGSVQLQLREADNSDNSVINTAQYKSVLAFRMDVESSQGKDYSKELNVPVNITLPVPEGMNVNHLKILHYGADGSVETIEPAINGDGTVMFTITHFSLFAFVDELLAQLGDINGDGEINAKDRMYLARALAGWDGYAVPGVELADFNGDGEVNAKDRMYLARKLAGWAGYE